MNPRSLTILFLLLSCYAFADNDRSMFMKQEPSGWHNRNFGICWYRERTVYNTGSVAFCSPGKVLDVQVSPAMLNFTVLYNKGKNNAVTVYSYADGSQKHTFRLSSSPTAIAYSENAKRLYIADQSRAVLIYNTSDYKLQKTLSTPVAADKICVSPNEYFLAIADEQMVYIWNIETNKIRKLLEFSHRVNHFAFSPDNSKMAILTDQGELLLYDTKSFGLTETYSRLGEARECMFHPNGKYIAMITAGNKITIINMKNPNTDRQEINTSDHRVQHLGYTYTADKKLALLYNVGAKFVFHPISDLTPDYQQLVAQEVDEKMDEWMKQMPGESLEDYHLRVNDESRVQQYALFENEVATDLAGDMVQAAEVKLGSYNQEKNMLEITFDNMPEIYLEVPQEDVAQFAQTGKLAFENSIYGVTKDDQFELLYTEVTNTETGKKYIFDNLEKQSLNYLANDDSFVPLDLIQQSSMEEGKLQEIREEIVTAAKEASLISEHTHIDVKTKVEAAVNADGEKIMNYAVEFNYDVEQEYSSKEDFGAGKYIISESQSAMAMLRIVQNAFENEFKQYIRPGKKVVIQVTGSADAAPINRKIAYKEEYGAYEDALVYVSGELTALSVSAATGIVSNEQLAFLRAMGVKNHVEKTIPALSEMNSEYDYYVNVSSERGSQYRRIGVKFVFVDAF